MSGFIEMDREGGKHYQVLIAKMARVPALGLGKGFALVFLVYH